jgi:hypothetical protein
MFKLEALPTEVSGSGAMSRLNSHLHLIPISAALRTYSVWYSLVYLVTFLLWSWSITKRVSQKC